jgi:acetyltransferase-like isoleucine patch superfamily enzyme
MDHGVEAKKLIRMQDNNVEAIEIGDDVWIAAGCKILRGSRIENGAVIGANSLVKGIIPSGMVALGSPAKAIKKRK